MSDTTRDVVEKIYEMPADKRLRLACAIICEGVLDKSFTYAEVIGTLLEYMSGESHDQ